MDKKLNIFSSAFGIRANLKTKELEIQKFWKNVDLFNKSQRLGNQSFRLHFGPPYANGDIHIGHALNLILKDITIRFEKMLGKKSAGLPGWDMHGLPIAIAVAKKNTQNQTQSISFRNACSEFAKEQVNRQIEQIKRLGVLINFDDYYQTLNKTYIAQELKIFAQLVRKKLIFTSQKPVFWSWSSKTALAETEVEYLTKKSTAVFFLANIINNQLLPEKTTFLLWTTTPWTIPENRLIAINQNANYLLITVKGQQKKMIVGEKALPKLKQDLNWKKVKILDHFRGKQLIKLRYQHPYLQKQGHVVHGDYVNFDEGTGIVHVAPAFGIDDYQLGKKEKIKITCPIDQNGYFNEDSAQKELRGVFYSKSEKLVLNQLVKNHQLVQQNEIIHQYPHDWRTKKPVIYRTTQQWYLNLKPLKTKIIETINDVEWIPQWAKKRMQLTLAKREDWCLSRQRIWGTPIPIFIDRNGNYILEEEIINQVADLISKHGDNLWWEWKLEKILTKAQIKKYQIVDRLKDTFDVWFDSGCSATIVEKNQSIDAIWEGNDQFRGWFNSLIIINAALNLPFSIKKILTHGFVNDEKGKKMSKSLGNVVNPNDVCNNLGADVLRLWVVSGNYFEDVNISPKIINNIAVVYTKIRNTIRFLINNLSDFDEKTEFSEQLKDTDYWILIKLNSLLKQSKTNFEQQSYHLFYLAIVNFVTVDLSQLYFDYAKNVLYTDHPQAKRRKQIQTTLSIIVKKLLCILTPILPHTVEEAYQVLNWENKKQSVHLEQWPETNFLTIDFEQQLKIIVQQKFIADLKIDIDQNIESAIKQGIVRRPQQIQVSFNCNADYQLFQDEKEYQSLIKTMQIKTNYQHWEVERKWKNEWFKSLDKKDLALFFQINQINFEKNSGKKCTTGEIKITKCLEKLCSRCLFHFAKEANHFCDKCDRLIQK